MKHLTVVKKVREKLGVEPEEGHNGKWYAQYGNQIISWYAEKPWNNPGGPLVASLYHVRRADDHSDSYTDYFAGSFRSNATQMINAVCPPEPKFKVGSLVRGKNNKRATRQGYAGKTGLVMSTSGYYPTVEWLGAAKPKYTACYPERDLELVSAS